MNVKNVLRETLSREILDEPLLFDHVKTEDYIMVALGIRSCSFLTVPAEFPNGHALGRRIDELCKAEFQAVLNARPANSMKGVLVRRLKQKIRESFRKAVFTSSVYEAHMEWSRKLSLQTLNVEVRPSIHELYLTKDSKAKRKLKKLMEMRKTARERIRPFMKGSTRKTSLAYPEELSSKYLASVGKLLGYPACCVKRYVNDRLSGETSAEIRASKQIRRLRKEGAEPNTHAYFARAFFPCTPACRNASDIGEKILKALKGINLELAALHTAVTKKNVEIIEQYPELIGQYRQKLRKAAEKLSKM